MGPVEILPMDEEVILTIEQMWEEMPITSKYYYDFDIEVYRKHKEMGD